MAGRWAGALAWAAAALAASASGCHETTGISLRLDSDMACSRITAVDIVVGSPASIEGESPSARAERCYDGDAIGHIEIVPSGADDDEVAVKVILGIDGQDPSECASSVSSRCVVARRLLHYVPGKRLTLPVALDQACLDVDCGPGLTCLNGGCFDATIDHPDECGADTCDQSDL